MSEKRGSLFDIIAPRLDRPMPAIYTTPPGPYLETIARIIPERELPIESGDCEVYQPGPDGKPVLVRTILMQPAPQPEARPVADPLNHPRAKQIVDFYIEGVSLRRIYRELHVADTTVRAVLLARGIQPRRQRQAAAD